MWKIKRDKADIVFSKYVRLRDKQCVRCGRRGTGPDFIHGLEASHFYGRANKSTRFCPLNVDCLCRSCHVHWGSTDREGYRNFKIKQLGENGFKKLQVKANTWQKDDRKWALLQSKALLQSVSGGDNT